MSNIRPQARLPNVVKGANSSTRAKDFSSDIALWSAILTCITLLVMGKLFPESARYWHSMMRQSTVPLMEITRTPSQWLRHTQVTFQHWVDTYQENEVLRARTNSLELLKNELIELQQENKALRAQLHLNPAPHLHYIPAQVLAQQVQAYEQSFVIHAGHADGIKKDLAVMGQNGLVGRILDVQPHQATVLLLNDTNSRIPVIGQMTRQRGILVGQNNPWLVVEYTENQAAFKAGEMLVTSGDGHTLPQGLPIGFVQRTKEGKWQVKPMESSQRLDWVSVVSQREAEVRDADHAEALESASHHKSKAR